MWSTCGVLGGCGAERPRVQVVLAQSCGPRWRTTEPRRARPHPQAIDEPPVDLRQDRGCLHDAHRRPRLGHDHSGRQRRRHHVRQQHTGRRKEDPRIVQQVGAVPLGSHRLHGEVSRRQGGPRHKIPHAGRIPAPSASTYRDDEDGQPCQHPSRGMYPMHGVRAAHAATAPRRQRNPPAVRGRTARRVSRPSWPRPAPPTNGTPRATVGSCAVRPAQMRDARSRACDSAGDPAVGFHDYAFPRNPTSPPDRTASRCSRQRSITFYARGPVQRTPVAAPALLQETP